MISFYLPLSYLNLSSETAAFGPVKEVTPQVTAPPPLLYILS